MSKKYNESYLKKYLLKYITSNLKNKTHIDNLFYTYEWDINNQHVALIVDTENLYDYILVYKNNKSPITIYYHESGFKNFINSLTPIDKVTIGANVTVCDKINKCDISGKM